MREVNFRAWDAYEKRMHHSPELSDLENAWRWFQMLEDEDSNNNIILMQYTGLKDKHGKDICEGDIVKYGDTSGTVRWSVDGARFYVSAPAQNTEFNNAIWNLNLRWESLEVIGNIYDNKEE